MHCSNFHNINDFTQYYISASNLGLQFLLSKGAMTVKISSTEIGAFWMPKIILFSDIWLSMFKLKHAEQKQSTNFVLYDRLFGRFGTRGFKTLFFYIKILLLLEICKKMFCKLRDKRKKFTFASKSEYVKICFIKWASFLCCY